MAKGDKGKVEKAIEGQNRLASQGMQFMQPQMREQTGNRIFRQELGSAQNIGDYGNIMDMYRNAAMGGGGLGFERVGYGRNPELSKALSGYGEFAETGGYSPADIANMRARGVSPIRATYARAQENLSRQKALSGGYSPNAPAAQAKMARELSMNLGDASTNLEAQLAEMKQRGRLAGLGGLSQNALADLEMQMRANLANQGAGLQAGMFNRGQELDALRGMTSLYGTTPAMAQLFGQQALQSQAQEMELMDMMSRQGLGTAEAQRRAAELPSNMEIAGRRTQRLGEIGAGIAGTYMGQTRQPTGRLPSRQVGPGYMAEPPGGNPYGY